MKPWEDFEEYVAKSIGGSRVRGSGNSDQHKGDVISARFLAECKQTGGGSYRISDALVRKIAIESLCRSRDWMFCARVASGDWCMLPMVALPETFDVGALPMREVGKTCAVDKSTVECEVLFASGRRAVLLSFGHAMEVLGYAD